LNNRFQVSGYRPQGNETSVGRVGAGSNVEALLHDPMVPEASLAVANGPENLKPDTCSLIPYLKAET
jgi:hypothetical protein